MRWISWPKSWGHRWDPGGATARSLVARRWTRTEEVLVYGRTFGGLRQLDPAIEQLEVEVSWAARRELARSIDDVLSRRMRRDPPLDRGASVAPARGGAARRGARLGRGAPGAGSRRVHRTGHLEYGVPPADGKRR
jgi:hypothetical protein